MNLPNDISSCHKLIRSQQELIDKLLERFKDVDSLREKVKELEYRLTQNSSNSHRPPSSDGLRKTPVKSIKPAFPRKGNKKQGGQVGHKGKTLEMVTEPDKLIRHVPLRCDCGHSLVSEPKSILEKRQVFDLPEPKLEVTEHQLQSCACSKCGQINTGSFPSEVASRVQYGSGVRTLTVLLNNGMNLPYGKVRQLFTDLFGYALNESTQMSAQNRCYDNLAPIEDSIRQALLASPVNHYDETGLRVAGKLHWLHNCSNAQLTYLFVHPKRGKGALESDSSDLPKYQGYAVHDRWRSYFLYENCKHADCCAHLLRDLQSLIDKGSNWAKQMHELLLEAYRKSKFGKSVCSNLKTVSKKYDRICRKAQKEEPPPKQRFKGKRLWRTKGRNLLEHFVDYKHVVLAFAEREHIPFTNNLAERDVRPAKVKQKVSGSFRTVDGAQKYARIQAFISTARKQNLNVFEQILATFKGENVKLAL